MAQTIYDTIDLPFVETSVNYVVDNGIKPVTYISPYGESNRRDETPDHRTVQVFDGRSIADRLTLDWNGFEFHTSPTAVSDFMDAVQIEKVYNPEVENIVTAATGASRVLVRGLTGAGAASLRCTRPRWVRAPLLKMAGINTALSDDLLRHTFASLDDRSLCRSAEVCLRWRRLASGP